MHNTCPSCTERRQTQEESRRALEAIRKGKRIQLCAPESAPGKDFYKMPEADITKEQCSQEDYERISRETMEWLCRPGSSPIL